MRGVQNTTTTTEQIHSIDSPLYQVTGGLVTL